MRKRKADVLNPSPEEQQRELWRKNKRKHTVRNAEYMRAYRERNREKSRKYDRDRYWADPDAARVSNKASRTRLKNTPKYIHTKYRGSARKRGLEFTLTMEQFMTFWQKPCHYCGAEIKTIGLDRVDNSVGYVFENIVPCHYRCNLMKSNLTQEEFFAACEAVFRKQKCGKV